MQRAFDPYHTWLGIPPDEQPPDHYRLLGATCFEKNLDTIRHAAAGRLAHLRSLQQGEHGDQARKLLREVADARACLLDAQKKAAYDRRLREMIEADNPAMARTRTVPAPQPPPPPGAKHSAKHSGKTPTEVFDLGQFGDYELLEKLGEGGMGVVYKAMHTKLRRRVALKILPRERLGDDRAVARFEREMAAVGALEHANVVRAYDAREIDGTRLLVMELVEGLDLSELVARGGPLPVADACETIRQAALGLQAAHEHGLVHRDVKPSNLMLSRQGQVKLLDLGLARFQLEGSPDDELTTGHHAFGTVAYMAPEQAADTHTVDIRADIYSLGGTLYKLLSGHPPFSGPKFRSNVDVLLAHANAPVPSIQRARPDVPDELAGVLERMLAKRPEERFATPAEVADAIGPLSADSDLAALLAGCEGRPAAAPNQALAGTQEPESSTSSALTRLFDRIKGDAADSPIAAPSSVAARRKRSPLVIASGVAAVALLAMVGAWVVFSNGWSQSPLDSTGQDEVAASPASAPDSGEAPSTSVASGTRLVLRWPEADRVDAKLEIDGREFDLPGASVESTAEQITLALRPGRHQLWIGRRGFLPYTEQIALGDGQSLEVTPTWSPSLADPDMAEPAPDEPMVVEPSPEPEDPRAEEARRRLAEYEATETLWREATGPAEALVDAWDFAGGLAALETVALDDEPLASRLVRRRDELRRLVDLKSRIIVLVNTAQPHLQKSDLSLRGQGGEVTGADQSGVTSTTLADKTESHAWEQFSGETVSKLMQRVVDLSSGDDLVASALLALVADDPQMGQRLFDSARTRGADITPYEAGLARAAFARAKALLNEEKYTEADSLLTTIHDRYGTLAWYLSAKPAIDAAGRQAKSGVLEAEAEGLYEEAVAFFNEKEFFDLRQLIEKLKADYPTSLAVTDAQREPSITDMEEAVVNIGEIITVRLDGQGDFKSIQAAIDAVPSPNSLIEIQDDGPYRERLLVSEKVGLTIRGKRGCWPIVTSSGAANDMPPARYSGDRLVDVLVHSRSSGTTIDRVLLLHTAPTLTDAQCLAVNARTLRLRRSLVYMRVGVGLRTDHFQNTLTVQDSVILTSVLSQNNVVLQNSLCVGVLTLNAGANDVRFSTVSGAVKFSSGGISYVALNCIFQGDVRNAPTVPVDIQHCNLMRAKADVNGRVPESESIKSCIAVPPGFRDPANLDYRLMPSSPCIGRASDGGDIGCRYTPEMIEMCKKALELRAAGVIDF